MNETRENIKCKLASSIDEDIPSARTLLQANEPVTVIDNKSHLWLDVETEALEIRPGAAEYVTWRLIPRSSGNLLVFLVYIKRLFDDCTMDGNIMV